MDLVLTSSVMEWIYQEMGSVATIAGGYFKCFTYNLLYFQLSLEQSDN